MKYGVSAAFTSIEASGTETEGAETNKQNVTNDVIVPSIFVEYAFGNGSIGLDLIPMSADVSDNTRTRTDVEKSGASGPTNITTSVTQNQKANASLKNHLTLYGHYNMGSNIYLKGGVVMVTLETDEVLPTGSKYANEDITGTVIGLGYSYGENMRVELAHTNYESISIKSSVARAGVSANNKIDADLDTTSLKFSYVF
jgi:hypothetical protein